MQKSRPAIVHKSINLSGKIKIPADQSIAHQALILGGLANGKTCIRGLHENEDILYTATAMQAMGAHIHKEKDSWIIHGTGNGCLLQAQAPLNFGTSAHLILGMVGSYHMKTTFIGDSFSSTYLMRQILDPLRLMGAEIETPPNNFLPLTLYGPKMANPICYHMPTASAHVKSAILLASLNTAGTTTVIEPTFTPNHTETMLKAFGAKLEVETNKEGKQFIHFSGQPHLTGQMIDIPGNLSFASFPLIAALLVENSDVLIENVLINNTRIDFIQTLWEMGANIELVNKRKTVGGDVADLRVKSSPLKGITIPKERFPSILDNYDILAVAAAFAEGKTIMLGTDKLHVKESHRLSTVIQGLKNNQVNCEKGTDFLIVHGQNSAKGLDGGHVVTHLDPRIAMCFLVFGLVSEKPITIDTTKIISPYFTEFIPLMQQLGGQIH
ncbi:3-phosphoshikimate 1-carboxyvinyltransferase [Bartonella sp. F02]|uniref:3-phosphoshikimate 1-carboxyvinyltransferase n=1 Tax=Bartonella sp. F02 TaxID=2967262 RepID=UPI0022A918D5|nr:3-phosphoshikimate 1-carboxyvinyltransferase [Bartonella sp. F02]MCZ2328012.1 3-phosphoshikimate 1-carboxyvinyltransferase [Bartonella sp. F02]